MIIENKGIDLEILDDLRNNVSKFAVGLLLRKSDNGMPRKYILTWVLLVVIPFLWLSCVSEVSQNQEMIDLLAKIDKKNFDPQNAFCAEAKLVYYDSAIQKATSK